MATLKVRCHWGLAEDVCLQACSEDGDADVNTEICMTQAVARQLAKELIAAADECQRFEEEEEVPSGDKV